MRKLIVIAILLIASTAWAGHLHTERHYQAIWCAERGGQTEVVMYDGTRCDCLTDTLAVEHDFAGKLYEGLGQALHYGMLTGKQAALLLIVESPGDWKYVERARVLIEWYNLPIIMFVMEETDGK